MLGKIGLEGAYETPSKADQSHDQVALYIAPNDLDRLHNRLPHRPGIQGITSKPEAESHATEVNNYIADTIKSHCDRLDAFAALSMHDHAQAGQELRRCVKDLGFHGALLKDVQHARKGGETYLFYDQPQYDEFWKVAIELDVPVYIHPAAPQGQYYR
ncbi:hypothetical protein BBP40_012002 [Aspergillus hancockii]|nr:hypothetical protein BBP40_012002 [Aspergillus hancockii]